LSVDSSGITNGGIYRSLEKKDQKVQGHAAEVCVVTENPAHDHIWKLDACLHIFGAVASRVAPEVDDSEGAFLPTSLE
jgi:hypothetical protein